MKKTPKIKEVKHLCQSCKNNSAEKLHSCPYAREINDNNDPEYCNCCDDCTQQCCDDI